MTPSFLDKLKPEVFKVKAIIVGSPTFNQGVLSTISPIFEGLKGLKFQNKIGAAFGSYRRSGQSVKIIEEDLSKCKMQLVVELTHCLTAHLDAAPSFRNSIYPSILVLRAIS